MDSFFPQDAAAYFWRDGPARAKYEDKVPPLSAKATAAASTIMMRSSPTYDAAQHSVLQTAFLAAARRVKVQQKLTPAASKKTL
jgi:hypothetical protein